MNGYGRHLNVCAVCGDTFRAQRANKRACSAECQTIYSRRDAKPGEAPGGEYGDILRGDPCSYCGHRGRIHVDHIVPLMARGRDHESNFTAACQFCNSSKQADSLLHFLIRRPVTRTDRMAAP